MKAKAMYILFLFFISTLAFSQEMRLVSGVIKDSSGEPMIGVSVQQKGTSNGTITNLDGYYEIEAPLGSKLEFSLIGMRKSEMVITNSNSKPIGSQFAMSNQPSVPEKKEEKAPSVEIKEKSKPEEKTAVKMIEAAKITPSREGQSLSPYFVVKSDSPDDAWMPLKKTDVAVNIVGVIADVCVKQIYINESKNTLEAIYVFPGSTRAAVYAMSMTIGDRRTEAKIKKKEQARQEYEQAKAEGKSTTLLEQHRPNVFQMNVANLLPGDTIVVEMRYTELLEHQNGIYEFVYPTVVGPRYSTSGEKWVERSINQLEKDKNPEFSIRTIIQAGMPIQKVSSVSHSQTVESQSPDQAVISLSNPKGNEGNRDYILQYELRGGKVESGLLRYEHGDENFFLLMMQPPKEPTLDQIPPREYIFIVDVSGSMAGFPLDLSKEVLRNLVSSLRPTDKFNVMLFESRNKMLHEESVPATEENIKEAMKVIGDADGGGGTNLYPAIQRAMNFNGTENFSRTFIILTDGFVTVEKEAFGYIRSHLNEANLFPVGIGSSVNRYLIEGLAHAGMGTPYIVTNQTEAKATGKKLIAEISKPVLTNISIDWGTFDVYDVEPAAIPDVFADRPILVYGKYKSPAKGIITISGTAGNESYEQKFDVSKARQEYNQALRYLWARNQIRYYDDYAQYYEGDKNNWDSGSNSIAQAEQVTNLGLKYNLLTKYTSFLAVDQTARIPQPAQSNDKIPYSSKQIPSKSSTPQTVSAPDFELTEESSNLEEVVVVGYGTQTRTHTTSGTSSYRQDASIVHSLQGRLAGLQISETSGEPGNTSKIQIRGVGSVMGNSSPLVVLDGTPVEYGGFSQMNMNDIESVTVLKDPSSAAIYGSKAANGVVVVTTKKPKQESRSITLSSSFSIEKPNRLPKLQNQYTQGRPENGVAVWNKSDESFAWGPEAGSVGASTYDPYDIFKTGYSYKNYLTFSGRGQNYNYSVKLGNNTQQGFIPESKFSETPVGLRLGGEWGNKFDFDIDVNYKNTQGRRLQRGYNMSSIMQGILLTPLTFDNRTSTLSDGSQRSAGNAVDNPYWAIDNNPFSDEANRLAGNFNMSYRLNNFLSFSYQLNGDYMSSESKTSLNVGSRYNPTGHIMDRDEKFKSFNSKFSVKFEKNWDKFYFNSIIGQEYSSSKRTIDRIDGYKLSEAGNYNLLNVDSISPFNQSLSRHSNAVFGKINLSYRQVLVMETAMRGEWSSVNDKTLLSPSLGLAVNLHNMFNAGRFSQIKVFGNIARADKETPLYLDPVYFNSATYNLNDASQHFESREVVLSNDLKPEKIHHYEVGTNIGFLNKFSLSASWYWKNGKDQLLPTQISTSSIQLENCGAFKTHGFEVSLDAYLIHNRDLTWNTQFIFSRERSTVTSLGGRKLMLAGIDGAVGSYAIEGQPLGVLYGTAYQRDAQGHMIIGNDGFPVKSDGLKVLGNPNPDWRLSWVNSVSYKNFFLSIVFDYKKGGEMWNGTQNVMNYYGTSQYSADMRNTTNYVFPGILANGQANNIPVSFYGNNINENRWVRYGQYGVGEDGIEDGSYIKLREISLGYKFRLHMLSRRTQMKLSLFATNVLLYSKYKGVDPETNLTGASNGFGLDYFNVPGVTSMGLSLNWEF